MLTDDLRTGFRADEPPLLRAQLLALDVDDHVLAIFIHHIVYDGWSRRIIAGDLGATYAAYVRGVAPRLEPLPARYVDYIAWQRENVAGAQQRALRLYWDAQLRGLRPLAVADGDAECTSTESDMWECSIPHSETAALRLLARHKNVTVATVLLAIFACVLHRLIGGRDIAIGMPVSDRPRLEFEVIVGVFINVVVIRATVAEGASFGDVLATVQARVQEAIRYQQLPITALVPDDSGRAAARSPYQVLFNFLPKIPGADFRFQGLESTLWDVPVPIPSVADLSLQVHDRRQQFLCRFVYNRQSVSNARVREIADGVVSSALGLARAHQAGEEACSRASASA
jgi:hypothetical protein